MTRGFFNVDNLNFDKNPLNFDQNLEEPKLNRYKNNHYYIYIRNY